VQWCVRLELFKPQSRRVLAIHERGYSFGGQYGELHVYRGWTGRDIEHHGQVDFGSVGG
jgi:hypothetical protein